MMFSRKFLFALVATIVAIPSLALVSVKSCRANGLTASDCNVCGIASASPPPPITPAPTPTTCTICIEQEVECAEIRPVGSPKQVERCVDYDGILPPHCATVTRQNYECASGTAGHPMQAITECETGTPHNDRPCTDAWSAKTEGIAALYSYSTLGCFAK